MPTKEPRRHVLLIDDQAIVGRAVDAVLAGAAADGEFGLSQSLTASEGVHRAATEAPDLILLDLSMPDQDGMETLRELRSMAILADVPIVVLSSTADSTAKEEAFARGANDYLVKMPDSVELLARFRLHTRGGRSAGSRAAEISRCADALAQAQDLAEVEELSLTAARHLTDADAGALWMLDPPSPPGAGPRPDAVFRMVCSQSDFLQARLKPGERLALQDVAVGVSEQSLIGYAAATGRPLRIDDVNSIAETAPYRFSGRVARVLNYPTRSVLAAPLRDGDGRIIGVLQLINSRGGRGPGGEFLPFSPGDESAFEVFAGLSALAMERARLIRGSILRLVAAAEMRDPLETGAHVQRVASYSVAIFDRWAAACAMAPATQASERDRLRLAAMLHDVGKISVPDSILKKPGPLDPAERDRMETHTSCGARLFWHASTRHDLASRDVALHHHERWDGKGYPGDISVETLEALPAELDRNPAAPPLSGESIPLFARVVAIADVYDALTSARCYKAPWPRDRVEAYLREESGSQFDPALVALALELLPYFESVRGRHPD